MKKPLAQTIYLGLSGLLLTIIGTSTLLFPVLMKTNSGIDLLGNINVINDVRAAGALYLAFAILSILSVFKHSIRFTSHLSSVLIFLSLGLGRLLSILLDGMPVEDLFKATILEFVIGFIGLFILIKTQKNN